MKIDSVYFFPEFMLKNPDVAEILKVCQKELDRFFNYLEFMRSQTSIITSSIYLERYEKMFGLSTNKSISNEERVNCIITKLNTRTNATVAVIETVISSSTGCQVKIIEEYDQYTFVIEITRNKNKMVDVEGIKKTLETIKPAHLAYLLYLVNYQEICNKVAVVTLKSKILYFEEVDLSVF